MTHSSIETAIDPPTLNLKEQVVAINRVTKVVKGGKNLSFSALVVVGDPAAKVVGFGTGKAKEVPAAIKKGIEAAKKNLRKVHVLDTRSRTRYSAASAAAGAAEARPGRNRCDRRRSGARGDRRRSAFPTC